MSALLLLLVLVSEIEVERAVEDASSLIVKDLDFPDPGAVPRIAYSFFILKPIGARTLKSVSVVPHDVADPKRKLKLSTVVDGVLLIPSMTTLSPFVVGTNSNEWTGVRAAGVPVGKYSIDTRSPAETETL